VEVGGGWRWMDVESGAWERGSGSVSPCVHISYRHASGPLRLPGAGQPGTTSQEATCWLPT
jgi:hypothetical protein